MVLRFAKEGAKCVVADIQKELSESVSNDIKKMGGESISVQMDVRNQKDIERSIDSCINHFGRIDILFNNVGIFDMEPFLESSQKTFNSIFDTNVKGMLFMMKAVAVNMVKKNVKTTFIPPKFTDITNSTNTCYNTCTWCSTNSLIHIVSSKNA